MLPSQIHVRPCDINDVRTVGMVWNLAQSMGLVLSYFIVQGLRAESKKPKAR